MELTMNADAAWKAGVQILPLFVFIAAYTETEKLTCFALFCFCGVVELVVTVTIKSDANTDTNEIHI